MLNWLLARISATGREAKACRGEIMNSKRTGENSTGEPRVEKSGEGGADDGSEEEADDSDVERESDDGEEDDDDEEQDEEEDEEEDEDEYIPSSSKRRYSKLIGRTICRVDRVLVPSKQRQEGGKAAGKPPPRKRGKVVYPACLSIPSKPPKHCEILDASSEQKDKRDEWKRHWGNYRALRFSAFLKRSYVQHWKVREAWVPRAAEWM